jgi:hypothetical protein
MRGIRAVRRNMTMRCFGSERAVSGGVGWSGRKWVLRCGGTCACWKQQRVYMLTKRIGSTASCYSRPAKYLNASPAMSAARAKYQQPRFIINQYAYRAQALSHRARHVSRVAALSIYSAVSCKLAGDWPVKLYSAIFAEVRISSLVGINRRQ